MTDQATFAWVCDVYIEELLKHPDLQGLRRICLRTEDAHGLYSQYGFELTKSPDRWMEIEVKDIYRRAL